MFLSLRFHSQSRLDGWDLRSANLAKSKILSHRLAGKSARPTSHNLLALPLSIFRIPSTVPSASNRRHQSLGANQVCVSFYFFSVIYGKRRKELSFLKSDNALCNSSMKENRVFCWDDAWWYSIWFDVNKNFIFFIKNYIVSTKLKFCILNWWWWWCNNFISKSTFQVSLVKQLTSSTVLTCPTKFIICHTEILSFEAS